MDPIRRALTAAAGLASAALLGYAAGSSSSSGGIGRSGRSAGLSAAAAAGLDAGGSSVAVLPTPTGLPATTTQLPASQQQQQQQHHRARQILRFGAPTTEGVKFFDDFVLAYDRRLRLPAWVFERLGPESRPRPGGAGVVDRADFEFYEDLGQHQFFRASSSDYAGSGYDRGHMAAAGNHKVSRAGCLQTFILSNVCPQVGNGFNRHLWNSLERHIRSLARDYAAVYVCTGPLFLPTQPQQPHGGSRRKYVQYEVLGSNSVAVPTHFFKVALLETHSQQFELLAYVVPNAAHPVSPEPSLDLFLVPLEAIERSAGFLIFDQLPRNRLTRVNKRPV